MSQVLEERVKSLIYFLLTTMTQTTFGDVTVTWSVFDTLKPKTYDRGEQVLKAPSVTRVSHSQNCYSLFIIVYEDNTVVAKLVAKTTEEMRNIPKFKVVKERIKSHCKGEEYSFSAISIPIEEEKDLFNQ